jgi:hypothetical protein
VEGSHRSPLSSIPSESLPESLIASSAPGGEETLSVSSGLDRHLSSSSHGPLTTVQILQMLPGRTGIMVQGDQVTEMMALFWTCLTSMIKDEPISRESSRGLLGCLARWRWPLRFLLQISPFKVPCWLYHYRSAVW